MTHRTEVHFEVGLAEFDALSNEGVTGIPAKPFFVCKHDLSDQRVYDLSWGTFPALDPDDRVQTTPQVRNYSLSVWQPDVTTITFFRSTHQVSRLYLGMEFTDWAPGWCFLRLGKRSEHFSTIYPRFEGTYPRFQEGAGGALLL